MLLFSYLLVMACALGAQKKCLIETVLLTIQNMFWLRNKKIFFDYAFLSGACHSPYCKGIRVLTNIGCCYVAAFHSFQQFFSQSL